MHRIMKAEPAAFANPVPDLDRLRHEMQLAMQRTWLMATSLALFCGATALYAMLIGT